MNEQQSIQFHVRAKFLDLQTKNSRFSLRAFAAKLDVNPGALSHILNGKRNVSRRLAEKISFKLELDPQLRSEILSGFPVKRGYRKSASAEPRYLELDAADFKVSAEWEHFAIMSLINCQGFNSSSEWIAERLGISLTKATQAIERLKTLGMISRNEEGKISRATRSYRTTDDIASVSMKKHHEQTLDMARLSLHREEVGQRDFTTLTLALNPQNLQRAKELVRKFQDDLSDEVESSDATEVYRLAIQLFPLTKLSKDKI